LRPRLLGGLPATAELLNDAGRVGTEGMEEVDVVGADAGIDVDVVVDDGGAVETEGAAGVLAAAVAPLRSHGFGGETIS